jgi:hypothetical protein
MQKWMTGCALGLFLGLMAMASGATLAAAQDQPGRVRLHRHAPLRVVITPTGRLYRQCADWHVIEHRAAGDTVVPRTRCWWATR